MTLDLRTLPGVELIRTGRWNLSTGPWTVTPADLVAAVAAHRARVLRRPVIKIGHTDTRFDGEPALGHVDNLRLADGGTVLIGDMVGVPGLLADVLASAYPDRSVEAIQNYTDATGAVHRLVLTAVSLLGATAPGVSTLRSLGDVGQLYGVAAASGQRMVRLDTTSTPLLTDARRRVVVRAAGTRRRQRRAVIILAAIDAATTEKS